MSRRISRRRFVSQTSATAAALPLVSRSLVRGESPNETVRLAAVGVGGKGWSDLNGAAKYAKVVALCDVDTGENRRGGLAAAAKKWPEAKRYTDWRELLDKEGKHLDAITVSTPDHMHAPVTMTALQHGIGAYTQKPLTRTVFEARQLAKVAGEKGLSTQMGNQHHSAPGYRTLVHWVQDGAIGKVTEAHTWSNRPIWPQGIDRPSGSDPVPRSLDWNLWLGVAPERPYLKGVYHPFKWRGWFDFGAGALGDMGCHIIDPAVWSLDLGAPLSVSYNGPKPHKETFPKEETLTYVFPSTKHTAGDTITMKWYDGGRLPSLEGKPFVENVKLPNQGVLLIGEKGAILCAHGGKPTIYPEDRAADVSAPKLEGIDHYGIWIDGIRNGSQPNSNFGYAGPLTETVLLGVIASRVDGQDLKWDSESLGFTNSDVANRYVHEPYRKGWNVPELEA